MLNYGKHMGLQKCPCSIRAPLYSKMYSKVGQPSSNKTILTKGDHLGKDFGGNFNVIKETRDVAPRRLNAMALLLSFSCLYM